METHEMEDTEARLHLLALEEQGLERDREIALLWSELVRQLQAQEPRDAALTAALGRLSWVEAEVAQMQSSAEASRELPANVSAQNAAQAEEAPAPAQPLVPTQVRLPAPTATAPTVAPPLFRRLFHLTPRVTAPGQLGSVIVSGFPKIFDEFHWKRFSLLWRGGRDGFGADDFHRRCDGHANTLTVILDTDRNVFGGFTPVKWESRGDWLFDKQDKSLRSFIFTLKNPHDVPALRFGLKAGENGRAVNCTSRWGPSFVDITVFDNNNANTDSYTRYFGSAYTNDTGLRGPTFFTGSEHFKLKEIEVFEVTD
jgi:hypothetical protein